MSSTPRSLRAIISIIGRRNVGKSSLLNQIIGQEVSIVSEIAGTTTDVVTKPYELLPFGPVSFLDTAGLDDEGELGEQRIRASKKALYRSDVALLVVDEKGVGEFEQKLIEELKKINIPFLIVFNKGASSSESDIALCDYQYAVSSDIEALKSKIIEIIPEELKKEPRLLEGLLKQGDVVFLVTPIDSSAPKGRMILPQVQTMRDVLDFGGINVVVKETELKVAMEKLFAAPSLVIADSQAIHIVNQIVPQDIPLTTFSTIFARAKGDFGSMLDGARKIQYLKDGDKILVAEACSHHAQDDDIGRVKIPNLLKKSSGKKLAFDFCSGHDFPDDLEKYALVVHCGACMLNRIEVVRRIKECLARGVPITNYGMAISAAQGVLERVVAPFR